ncbi:hypothetical protein GGS21DRAFT_279855 [Xylaria nigripes]|nr:hypothetical protein GGS21DRAFT_279855 [Xylaria nigripes]
MKHQVLFLAYLAALGTCTTPSNHRSQDPDICAQSEGIYDICDTPYSFIRCDGHDAILVQDCRQSPSTYCRIVDDKGHCDGKTPPDM